MGLSGAVGDPPTAWVDEVEAGTASLPGTPFVPWMELERFTFEETGRQFATYLWSCPVLLPNGRCGDYENRPNVCRSFEPASDLLCVHYGGAEAGADDV